MVDLAATEIYMDKVGEAEPKSLSAIHKMEVMTWFYNVATYTRILGPIVAGYIYQYYSKDAHVTRRPFALYAPPFAICVVLMGMCVIFYKRFQLKSQSETPATPSEKESMLQPAQLTCINTSSH
jgi:MFS family permease